MVESMEDPRRVDPAFVQAERPMLESWLDWHRVTLLLKCEGLDDAGRKARPVPTSLLSLHGLVRHMAEVERNWFRRVLAGEDLPGRRRTRRRPGASRRRRLGCRPGRVADRGRPRPRRRRRARPRRHRPSPRRTGLAAVDLRTHDRGVRPPQRPRRPHPGAGRRGRWRLSRRPTDRIVGPDTRQSAATPGYGSVPLTRQ
jgi:hypothetical protein